MNEDPPKPFRLRDLMILLGHDGLYVPGQADPLPHFARPPFVIRIPRADTFYMYNPVTGEVISGGVEEYAKLFNWNLDPLPSIDERIREKFGDSVANRKPARWCLMTIPERNADRARRGLPPMRYQDKPREKKPRKINPGKFNLNSPNGTILYSRQAMLDCHPGKHHPITQDQWAALMMEATGCGERTASMAVRAFVKNGIAMRTEMGYIPTGKPLPIPGIPGIAVISDKSRMELAARGEPPTLEDKAS